MIDKGKLLGAVRDFVPGARVSLTGEWPRVTLWITEVDRERCLVLDLSLPDMSEEVLIESILEALDGGNTRATEGKPLGK